MNCPRCQEPCYVKVTMEKHELSEDSIYRCEECDAEFLQPGGCGRLRLVDGGTFKKVDGEYRGEPWDSTSDGPKEL